MTNNIITDVKTIKFIENFLVNRTTKIIEHCEFIKYTRNDRYWHKITIETQLLSFIDEIEISTWIENNIIGFVAIRSRYEYFFQLETDAAFFKLRWIP